MLNSCQQCRKYNFCVSLYPEAELIANHDYVEQKESLHSQTSDIFPQSFINEQKSRTHLIPAEKKILRFLAQGLSRKDIAQVIEISRHCVDVHLISNFQILEISERSKQP